MKSFIKTILIGGLGGAFFVLVILPLTYRANFFGSARVIDKILPAREVKKVEKEVITFVSEEKEAGEAISKSQDSIVAIKSYQGGSLIRFGSGIAITQDGLIVTVNQVVPQNATDYQIFTGDKILRASVVLRSTAKNLALLKISDESLKPASFDEDNLKIGNNVFIIGKLTALQKLEPFVNKAFVSFVDSRNRRIILDGRYENYLSGASLISGNGSFRGLAYIDGERIIALPSTFVEDFVKSYLK